MVVVAERSSIVMVIVDSVMIIGSSFTFIPAIASSTTTSRCSNKQRG